MATLIGSSKPPMLYDYYGFPREAYQITYPAPGDPFLAKRIVALLKEGNVASQIDSARGFDHGLFIPLKMMYPQAEIPALQISLLADLNASTHLALGEALSGLIKEHVLSSAPGFLPQPEGFLLRRNRGN